MMGPRMLWRARALVLVQALELELWLSLDTVRNMSLRCAPLNAH